MQGGGRGCTEETLPASYFYLAAQPAWHHGSHHDKFGRKSGYLIVRQLGMLFLSGGTIDFSLSCCRCQHYVLVYHAGLSVYTVHLYTPINMFPPAPHAELAALSAPSRTVVVARLVPSVAAAHCCCDLHGGGRGSPRHSGAGGDEASS